VLLQKKHASIFRCKKSDPTVIYAFSVLIILHNTKSDAGGCLGAMEDEETYNQETLNK
jgi:hypothetical protein